MLEIDTLKDHGYRLIAVASEKLKKQAGEYKEIKAGDDVYKIVDRFTVRKTDSMFPESMFLLATGKKVDTNIWKFYKKSEFIVLFLVEKNGK